MRVNLPRSRAELTLPAIPYGEATAAPSLVPFASRARLRPARSPVRVGILSPAVCIGGVEAWVASLVRHVPRDRVEWTGIALAPDGVETPEGVALMDSVGLPVFRGLVGVREVADQVDVLVTWGNPLSRVAEWLEADRPAIVTVAHGVGDWTREMVAGSWAVEGVAAVSEAALAAFVGVERSRARVVPNCVDPARLLPRASREQVRAGWGVPLDAPIVVHLSRLSPEKNPCALDVAVRVLRERTGEPWFGVHQGPGWWLEQAKAYAAAHGHPGASVFAGPTDDPAAALLAADWSVLPSLEEGFGLALAESWALGVPTIASRTGIALSDAYSPLARLVSPGCTGHELAEAILADRSDPAGTAARVAEARRVALADFAPGAFGRSWADVLTGAAAGSWRPDLAAETRRVYEVSRAIESCPSRSNVQPNCRCTADCAERGKRVDLRDCQRCQERRLPADEVPEATIIGGDPRIAS